MENFIDLSNVFLNLGAGGIALFICISLWKLLQKSNSASTAEASLYEILSDQIKCQNDQINSLVAELKTLKEECEKHRAEDQTEIYQLKIQVQEYKFEIEELKSKLPSRSKRAIKDLIK
jgi:predicted  nucleic acid-binding Zn-ribbon protein